MVTRILFQKNALTSTSACEGVNQCYITSGRKFIIPPFSFHLCVCSYRFLQERSQMIPTQEQHRLVEIAVETFLRVQMIFDPWSNTLIVETSALFGIRKASPLRC